MKYTVALSERGDERAYYIGTDGNCHGSPERSKPLTKDEAELARRLFLKGARKAGRPLACRVEALPRGRNR